MLVFSERRFVLLLLIAAAIDVQYYNQQQQQQSGQLQRSAIGHQRQRAPMYSGSGGDGDQADRAKRAKISAKSKLRSAAPDGAQSFVHCAVGVCKLLYVSFRPLIKQKVCSQNLSFKTFERNDAKTKTCSFLRRRLTAFLSRLARAPLFYRPPTLLASPSRLNKRAKQRSESKSCWRAASAPENDHHRRINSKADCCGRRH